MAQKIYNNGSDGKILMSSAGKVIRQPYEFGNAFQASTLNNYILIQGISVSLIPSTEIVWMYDNNALNRSNICTRVSPSNNNYTKYSVSPSMFSFTRNGYSESGINQIFNQNAQSFLENSMNFFACAIDDTTGYNRCNNGVNSTYARSNIIDTLTSSIFLGDVKTSTTTNTPVGYANRQHAYHRYILYSRKLSVSEITFIYNNRLGQNPQTMQGVEIDLMCNKAEILNTGGADFVGVRDYSGNNRHGQIMKLPAGPLSEQLAYANEYLFVPFLT